MNNSRTKAGRPSSTRRRFRFPRSLQLTREHARWLLQSIPAMIAVLAIIVTAVEARLTTDEDLVVRYSRRADRFARTGNYQGALVCYERLAQLRPEMHDFTFQQVITLKAMGEPNRALGVAAELAPIDRPGYPPAHLWIANQLLNQPGRSAETLREAEAHLRLFLKTSPRSETEAHELLGQLYNALGRHEEAELQLKRAVPERPGLLLPLAWACQAQGKKEAGRAWALQANNHYAEIIKKDPSDHDARLKASAALLFLERYPEAEAVLLQGVSRFNEPRFHVALAQAYELWAAALKTNHVSIGKQFELLQRGLKHDPSNRVLINGILDVIQGGGAEADNARIALKSALVNGQGTAAVHLALGIDAWNRGEVDDAQKHWDASLQLKPEMTIVENNLAWVLAFGPKPDLKQALDLVNRAVEHEPNFAAFRHTRGLILAKLGRWKESLADLDIALRLNPNLPKIHESLADTYDHLGLRDVAAAHRRSASRGPTITRKDQARE